MAHHSKSDQRHGLIIIFPYCHSRPRVVKKYGMLAQYIPCLLCELPFVCSLSVPCVCELSILVAVSFRVLVVILTHSTPWRSLLCLNSNCRSTS